MDILTTLSLVEKVEKVEEQNLDEMLFKLGTLSFIKEIGVPKEDVANYFNVSTRTIEKYMKDNRKELLNYGDMIFESKKFVTDKIVGHKISSKSRNIALLNKKHILFLACVLVNKSDTAKSIVRYLLELEKLANDDLKARAIEQSIQGVADSVGLREQINELQSKLTKITKELESHAPLIQFAQTVQENGSDITIDEFAKVTFDKLKVGRNTMFSILRKNNILNSKNIPFHKYIEKDYLRFKAKRTGSNVNYQAFVTPKGQIYLLKKLSKKMEVTI